jgi:hypothetical protein
MTWSTGPKQTIQMTKFPLTRHGKLLLQTPMTKTLPRVYLGTYRNLLRHKNQTSGNIYEN